MTPPFYFSRPPRAVPSTVRLRVLFGGMLNQMGWFFFGFGMIFVWIFLLHADLTSFYLFRGDLETVPGTLTTSQRTSFSEGGSKGRRGTPIYQHQYTYTADGIRYDGVSYSTGYNLQAGARVTIEYPRGKPGLSRIHGMRRAAFGPVVAFVIIFPLVGAGLLAPGLRQGWRANRLLAQGKVALGTLQSKEPTNSRINNKPVYKLTFQFRADDGQTYSAVAKTYQPGDLEDDQQEELVYDPLFPTCAVMVDSLPGSPRIDERGLIQPCGLWPALRVLIVPLITMIGHTIYVCAKILP